jgi:hypothetical protein
MLVKNELRNFSKKEIPPVFKGQHDVAVLLNALKTIYR